MKRLYVVLGFFCIGLGSIGIVLPFLPTTPFFLAAVFLLAKGSERFHRWFLGTKLYQKHLGELVKTKSMSAAAKAKLLVGVTLLLSLAFWLGKSTHLRIVLVLVALGHYYYFLFRVKTAGKDGTAPVRRRLLGMAASCRHGLAAAVFYRWLALLCNILIIAVFAGLIQKGFDGSLAAGTLLYSSLLFVGVLALRAFAIARGGQCAQRAAGTVKKKLRGQIYDKLLRLGLGYRRETSSAAFVQMSVDGIEQLQAYFGGYLPQLFYSLAAPATLFCFFFFLSPKVAVILLLMVPLIPLSLLLIQRVAGKRMRRHWNGYTDLGKRFLENLQGLTTLKIYQADQKKHEEMNAAAENFRKITMGVLRMQLVSVTVMDLIAYGATALGITLAIGEAVSGRLPLWGGVCIILLCAEFFLPLRLLGSFFHTSMSGVAAAERIFAFLDVPGPVPVNGRIEAFSISFHHCGFGYEPERPALVDITAEIPSPGFIAIVGESGSGKSTLAKILAGECREYTGSAQIGGVELRDIAETELVDHVLLTVHDAYLFAGTVRENLRLAAAGAGDDELLAVLKKAGLEDFGLDLPVREQGSNFSGGQRQRLTIARALLRKADVYIFDEATANIDVENEEKILAALTALAKEKTVLLITHRMALASLAEKILVLKGGHVLGFDRHEVLLKENPYYARLYCSQQQIERFMEEGEEVVYG